ncbi:ParB N-terminal domain-containing protein [Desertifilum sp. FACHB-1129]|uniref:sulfiredoxin n=2 Tax=Cyanophyceae TaxID=3028117 RepID=A0A1E5QNR4_9CYAN|nr:MULTISPECIES: sulfiredoxin [Cyanophyceae]MCD8489805.1 ParB N-terminal domain-containing protein [Desertifilum sp.]MDA0212257.1 sulfiredoxin [Cyanobacteria bacterium FC1]MDI9635299.1 sulfiredoxin [Geitlerinema splendidum]MDK3158145.1 sulfiredoxin [Kamptonema cortianum]MDL5047471.1 sulfiredoxin [Oscillatoria amoena NRMC-F 0135]NES95626.1 ParB N-terminal domain-containing protein [Desertifilum sp. SIO1I2]
MLRVEEIPLNQIRRPLPRQTDSTKVAALMESIQAEGLREPIDVLEVEGQYYGFSGCHRYEAHQRLGKETIRCRIRRAPRAVLQKHLA